MANLRDMVGAAAVASGAGAGYWTVDFYDFSAPLALLDGDLASSGDVAERARRNGARQGTPVIVHTAGRVDARVNAFFRSGVMVAARPATWRRYAFALVVWLNFLEVLGKGWDEATAADVEAFKEWRLTDGRNRGRVAPTSFDTDRAALNSFYSWAKLRYGVANPVPSATRGRGRGAGGDGRWGTVLAEGAKGRDGLRPAQARRRQVKWVLRPAFEQWRDIGLRGYGFDGLRRTGWRGGGCEDRDAAFVDGLYGTGLRLTEWASVLDVELPQADGRRFGRAWLAAACAKGGKAGRVYRVPRSVLVSLAGYLDPLEGSRRVAIARAQTAGRYEGLHGVRVVTGYNARSRSLSVLGPEGTARVSTEVLGPMEVRACFLFTQASLSWPGPYLQRRARSLPRRRLKCSPRAASTRVSRREGLSLVLMRKVVATGAWAAPATSWRTRLLTGPLPSAVPPDRAPRPGAGPRPGRHQGPGGGPGAGGRRHCGA